MEHEHEPVLNVYGDRWVCAQCPVHLGWLGEEENWIAQEDARDERATPE